MAGYLRKYVKTYRVIAEYSKDTNDFPRLEDGTIDPSFDDLYIACYHGNRIYHYGQNILVAYIPSIGRGRNILRSLYESKLGSTQKFIIDDAFSYEALVKELNEHKIIFDFEQTDTEILFKFKAECIEQIAELLKAKKEGVKIQAFSSRNLPRAKYTIPAEDLALYKEITRQVSKENLLIISHITKAFLREIEAKKLIRVGTTADMKLKCLKGKEYIHLIGLWGNYIDYLKKQLEVYNGG